ncbi:uncharacterized protein LOC143465674 isoform X1 [Clavelina lepadiformis]|uniref:uncharacterized protein LOC143465674 isoform X1 n=1 Tax=Clavelina lepadiformis TaxID=159417 RepID=UPI004040F63A
MSKRCIAVLMLIFIMSLSSNFASSVPYDQYTSHPSYTSYEDSSYDTDTSGSGTSDSDYYTDDEDLEYDLPETGDYVDGYEAVLKNNEKVKNSVPESNWFPCDNNKLWLTLDKKCDGIRDCFDCSDEDNCTHATDSQFFFCYKDAKDTDTKRNATYSFNDPYCIPKHQFCDGEKDCFSGADERQIGYGFKCVAKGSQKTCLLAGGSTSDKSLECEGLGKDKLTSIFRCLDERSNISIFEHQVCDGVMDCPDLSDECLCQEPATHQISRLCDRLCLAEVWSFNGRIRPHCASCMPGNIFDELTESKGKNSTNTASSLCLETFRICQENRNEEIDSNLENVCISMDKIKTKTEFVKCISIDGTFREIRAKLCDKNAECFFGEDECVAECLKKFGTFTNHFCKLLDHDFGYRCYNQTAPVVYEAARNVQPCNGIIDCVGTEDEAFCSNLDIMEQTFDTKLVDISIEKESNVTQPQNPNFNLFKDKINSIEKSVSKLPGNCSMSTTTRNKSFQYGMIFLTAIGIIGNLFGIALSIVNSCRICRKMAAQKHFCGYFFALTQECVMCLSSALAKILFCGSLAYILFSNAVDPFLCGDVGPWHTNISCQYLGPLLLISVQITWYALVLQLLSVHFIGCLKRFKKVKVLNCLIIKTSSKSFMFPTALFFGLTLLLSIVWIPAIVATLFVTNLVEPVALVTFENMPRINQTFINVSQAMILSERVFTLTHATTFPQLITFNWQRFENIISKAAPSFKISLTGTVGYFSYSKYCLPFWMAQHGYLHQFNEPYSSFSTNLLIAITVLSVCALFLSLVLYCTTYWKHKLHEYDCAVKHTVSFTVADFFTWLPLCVIYFVNVAQPNLITADAYELSASIILTINFSIISTCLWIYKCTMLTREKISRKQGLAALANHDEDSVESNCERNGST